MTYGITIRSRICVRSLDPTRDPRDLIRKMEIPQGEIKSENYGFQHTHLDERFDSMTKSKQNRKKKQGETGCQVKHGCSLSAKGQCLKMGKWSLLLMPRRERKFFEMANKT